jgi:hypothetical protein
VQVEFCPSYTHVPQEIRAVPAPEAFVPRPVNVTDWVLGVSVTTVPLARDETNNRDAAIRKVVIGSVGAFEVRPRRVVVAGRDKLRGLAQV